MPSEAATMVATLPRRDVMAGRKMRVDGVGQQDYVGVGLGIQP